jgi:hypothetical protein
MDGLKSKRELQGGEDIGWPRSCEKKKEMMEEPAVGDMPVDWHWDRSFTDIDLSGHRLE